MDRNPRLLDRRRQTERDIQHAALTLALEVGYAFVTTDMIASRAGISRRTFFNYYPNKEAAVAGPGLKITDESRSIFRNSNGFLVDDVLQVLARLLAEREIDRDAARMLAKLAEDTPELRPVFHQLFEILNNDIVDLVSEKVQRKDQATLLTHLLTQAISISYESWATDSSIPHDRIIDLARELVFGLEGIIFVK